MRHTGTQTRIGVLVPKLGSIKPTVSLSKEAKQYLSWRTITGRMARMHR